MIQLWIQVYYSAVDLPTPRDSIHTSTRLVVKVVVR